MIWKLFYVSDKPRQAAKIVELTPAMRSVPGNRESSALQELLEEVMNADLHTFRRLMRTVIVVTAWLGLGGLPALAQFGSASVLGYVRDNSGAVVSSATVTLTNVGTNVTQKAQTDREGKYEFSSVPIGNYQIVTTAAGFQATKTETFNLSTDARQRVDIDVKPGAISEVVEVTSAAELLETQTS